MENKHYRSYFNPCEYEDIALQLFIHTKIFLPVSMTIVSAISAIIKQYGADFNRTCTKPRLLKTFFVGKNFLAMAFSDK